MAETKTPEALLQEAFLAEQAKTKQQEIDLGTEREARGKAEQQLREANALIESLNQRNATLTTNHTKAVAELADANALIDSLNKQLGQEPEAAAVPTVTLGVGAAAKTYRFVVPQFHFAGFGKVVAAEVKSNSPLLKALVEAGAKVLELVEKA